MKLKELILNMVLSFLLFSMGFSVFCIMIFGSLFKGMILGILAGILFSFLINLFTVISSRKMKKLKEKLCLKKKIFYDGAANHVVGKESVGGWIFLMEDELFFHPHSFNHNLDECNIPYLQIEKVITGKKIRSIDLYLYDGKIESFIVNNRKEWIETIEKILRKR